MGGRGGGEGGGGGGLVGGRESNMKTKVNKNRKKMVDIE